MSNVKQNEKWPPEKFDAWVTHDGSSLYLVEPVSDAAREWLDENLGDEQTWWHDQLVVEHRFIVPLIEGMESEGLKVGRS